MIEIKNFMDPLKNKYYDRQARCKNCPNFYWAHRNLSKDICKGFEHNYRCSKCRRELKETEKTYIELDKANCYAIKDVCKKCVVKERMITQEEYNSWIHETRSK